jgi:hypothetical protein
VKGSLRNDLVRELDTKNLDKYVNLISKENVNKLTKGAQKHNVQEIQTMAILAQKNVYNTCGKITDMLRLMHLKLREINTINQRINSGKPGSFRRNLKGVHAKTLKLRRALKKEKLIVIKVMKAIAQKQKRLIKALAVYDKKFAAKNKTHLKNLLSAVNLQLKPYMTLPYFKKAYSELVAIVLSKANKLSPAQLKDPIATAHSFILKHWKKILEKAKAEWEKTHKAKGKARKGKAPAKGNKNKKAKRVK